MQHQNVSLSWVVSFFGYSNQLWRCISSSVFQESWLNTSISYYCCIAEKTVCPSGLIRVFNNWYWWKITTVRCICICNYTMIHFCAPVILASQYNLAEICVLEILSFSVCCLTMGYHQDYNPDLLVWGSMWCVLSGVKYWMKKECLSNVSCYSHICLLLVKHFKDHSCDWNCNDHSYCHCYWNSDNCWNQVKHVICLNISKIDHCIHSSPQVKKCHIK